jgi:hypothetical protein
MFLRTKVYKIDSKTLRGGFEVNINFSFIGFSTFGFDLCKQCHVVPETPPRASNACLNAQLVAVKVI